MVFQMELSPTQQKTEEKGFDYFKVFERLSEYIDQYVTLYY